MSQETHDDQTTHTGDCDGPQSAHDYDEAYKAAGEYYDLLAQLPNADRTEVDRLKVRMDDLLAPYNTNPAWSCMVSLLSRKRLVTEQLTKRQEQSYVLHVAMFNNQMFSVGRTEEDAIQRALDAQDDHGEVVDRDKIQTLTVKGDKLTVQTWIERVCYAFVVKQLEK